ncbi:MAG: AAA family ATPase [Candidatus Omnitrophica bacterium]|nr:AAA family ATPase [Candidatus Omnitrophota bacterium]MBU1872035.1 AAA family ATPase [Candidatus Omnitrophota bacterium]
MGKIIAVCNQKGGTGKTTTVVNLCSYLAEYGKSVLVIDLDPQANATSGLGIDKYSVTKSTYSILIEEGQPSEAAVPTAVKNLTIIPANLDLTGAEVELVGMIGREYRLKKAITSQKNHYDFIFIDCPPSLGLLTVNALGAADCVLIPVQCEYYALEGLTQLMNTINLVRENLNADLAIEGILLTMADFRTNLTNQVIEEVQKYFQEAGQLNFGQKSKVYETIIPRNIRLTEAPSFGKPIMLYDKHSIGARRYQDLANEILGLPISSSDDVSQGTESIKQGE